jgi:MFS family permease
MTQFVVVIGASIVNVALPSIGHALHFARTDLGWVVNAYVVLLFLSGFDRGCAARSASAEVRPIPGR